MVIFGWTVKVKTLPDLNRCASNLTGERMGQSPAINLMRY